MEFVGFDLVVSIVDNRLTTDLLDRIEKVGVTGNTILPGRGRSSSKEIRLFGITIEPQRDCIITLTTRDKTKEIFDTIMEFGNLNKPGQGLVFVLEVKEVGGIRI